MPRFGYYTFSDPVPLHSPLIPEAAGIYVILPDDISSKFFISQSTPIYIGQTGNLRERLANHEGGERVAEGGRLLDRPSCLLQLGPITGIRLPR